MATPAVRWPPVWPSTPLAVAFGRQPTGAGLSEAVTEANTVVWQHSLDNPELRGMGTTLTAVALVNEDGHDVLALVNVGDSRSYRFHDGADHPDHHRPQPGRGDGPLRRADHRPRPPSTPIGTS